MLSARHTSSRPTNSRPGGLPPTLVSWELAIKPARELRLVPAETFYEWKTLADGKQPMRSRAGTGRRWPLPGCGKAGGYYMMPILDGAEMLRAMRDIELQRDIPCMVMSSVPEATVQERVGNYAAFVRKPFQLAAMIKLVAAILAVPRPEP